MGKITCRRLLNKRANPIQRESEQQEVSVIRQENQRQNNEHEPPDPRPDTNHPGENNVKRISAHLSPSSLSFSAVASDRSHVSAPALTHNVVENLTINNNFVIQSQPAVTEQIPRPQKQEALPDAECYTKTVLKTPKKLKKHQKIKGRLKRKKLDFGQAADENRANGGRGRTQELPQRSIMGEIAAALVSSEYHCGTCTTVMPQFGRDEFSIKCSRCKVTWRCAKVPCTCEADITVEEPDRQQYCVTLQDALLRSIVNFNDKGYCDTDQIEKDVLQVGSVSVEYENGAVKSVRKIQPIRT